MAGVRPLDAGLLDCQLSNSERIFQILQLEVKLEPYLYCLIFKYFTINFVISYTTKGPKYVFISWLSLNITLPLMALYIWPA